MNEESFRGVESFFGAPGVLCYILMEFFAQEDIQKAKKEKNFESMLLRAEQINGMDDILGEISLRNALKILGKTRQFNAFVKKSSTIKGIVKKFNEQVVLVSTKDQLKSDSNFF